MCLLSAQASVILRREYSYCRMRINRNMTYPLMVISLNQEDNTNGEIQGDHFQETT